MTPAEFAGIAYAFEKFAEFGKSPAEGVEKTISGVTKVFKGGKWVSKAKPGFLSGLLGGGKNAPVQVAKSLKQVGQKMK